MNLEFVILEGPQAGRRLPLGTTPVTIGRSLSATMPFPEDKFMSGMHLTAQAGPQGVLIADMHSTNGSSLNGQRITHAVAKNGDIVKIGSLTMQVVDENVAAGDAALPPPIVASAMHTSLYLTPPPVSKADAVLQVLRSAEGTLFCLLDAAADEMIPALLQVAQEQVQMQSLYEGDSARELARWAPYLLKLPPESPLLRVLIDKGWGKGWASFFTANATFEEIRKHFRKFLMVQIENGKEVYFRFYDPRVLRDFLPTTNSSELTTFFGPVALWIVEAPNPDEIIRMRITPAGLDRTTARLEPPTLRS